MKEKILAALTRLDKANDAHWTADGLPRVEVVEAVYGHPLKRKDITDAAPHFTRSTAPEPAPAAEGSGQAGDQAPAPEPPVDETPEEAPVVAAADNVPAADADPDPVPADEEPLNILEMDRAEVLGSQELNEVLIQALEQELNVFAKRRKQLDDEEKIIAAQHSLAVHYKLLHERNNPPNKQANINAYLEGQAVAIAQKVRRAQAFLEHGTTAKDVAAQLSILSPLDQGIAKRNRSSIDGEEPGRMQDAVISRGAIV